MASAKKETLQEIHQRMAENLLKKLQSGEDVSTADYRVIKDFLKDNNIECLPTPQEDISAINDLIPDNLSFNINQQMDDEDSQDSFTACG